MPDISRPAAARRNENITDFVEKTLKRSRKKEKNHLLHLYHYGFCRKNAEKEKKKRKKSSPAIL